MVNAASLSNKAIREYAERVGEHYKIYDGAGWADVELLTEKLGGRIALEPRREALQVDAPGSFTVFLSQMTSARRDRFTIAHEIGHYFLHYLLPNRKNPAAFGRGERNPVETQANVFASALLMPSKEFTEAHSVLKGDHWALARQFNVSPAAAEVRSRVLELE